ncbi:MAG: lysophospholipase, partial [Muribaculaceae bacterium]|nr:lysophospholipase [Muribaculaceae bacterium]
MPATGAEQEFVVRNEAASVVLCGTLQTPDNVAPKALVVMASGSGQQNRDEEIFGHKIFKDIADRLSCSGYASLRLDDRGTGSSSGDFSKATTDDFTDDIACALKSVDSVFTDIPIGVLGHSEGGSVAIRLGAHNPLCEFIITLAAPAWRGDSIIMSQARALAENASGNWSAENATLQRRLLDICLSPIPSALARPVFISTMTKEAGSAGTLPQVQASIAASADAMLSKWYREFLRYDPSDDI